MSLFYPKDYGTVGAGNDTAAIQGAINAIRTNHGGKLVLDRDAGFVTDCLDATNCSNMEIVSDLGCIVTASVTHTAPVIDLCNSHNVRIDNLVMTLPSPGLPIIYPKAAFLIFGSDKTTLNNVTVNGTASSAILAAVGASSVSIRDTQLIQWDPHAPTLMLSTTNDWGISSMFYSGSLSATNVPDWYLEQTELHQLGNGEWTVYMRNADHIVFSGGLSANFHTAHVLFQGTCSNITDVGRKFYKGDTSSNPNAQMVYQAGGSTSSAIGLVSVNPSRSGITTLFGGTGSFQYCSAIPAQT